MGKISNKFYAKITLILFIISINNNFFAKVIIFDIYDVLFSIPNHKSLKYLGSDIIKYLLIDGKNKEEFKEKFFRILSEVPIPNLVTEEDQFFLIDYRAKDHKMPLIIYLWQTGKLHYKSALEYTKDYVEQLDKNNFFFNKREKNLILKAVELAFDLNVRKQVYKPIKKGIEILKCCALQKENNKKKHSLYILSNMDKEIIEYFYKEYPDIFHLFDGLVYSAEINLLKPNPKIYEYLLKKYSLNPDECIFIDDQKENIEAAQTLRITSILCNDFNELKEKLKTLNIITKYSK